MTYDVRTNGKEKRNNTTTVVYKRLKTRELRRQQGTDENALVVDSFVRIISV